MKKNFPKMTRKTFLKKLESCIANDTLFTCSLSGDFDFPSTREWMETLDHATAQSATLLGLDLNKKYKVVHAPPIPDGPSEEDLALGRAMQMLEDAIVCKMPEVFDVFGNAIRRWNRSTNRHKDPKLAQLFIASCEGAINVKALARKLAGTEKPETIERRLRRLCKRMAMPVLPPGAPQKQSNL